LVVVGIEIHALTAIEIVAVRRAARSHQ